MMVRTVIWLVLILRLFNKQMFKRVCSKIRTDYDKGKIMKRYKYLTIEVVVIALFVFTIIAQPCWSAVYNGTGKTDPNLVLLSLTEAYYDGTNMFPISGGADAGDPNTTRLLNSAFIDGNFDHDVDNDTPPLMLPEHWDDTPPVESSVWIMDLGRVYNIHGLILYAGCGNTYFGMARTKIECSENNATWFKIGETPGVVNASGTFPSGTKWEQNTGILSGVTARYIKIIASNFYYCGPHKLDQLDIFVTLAIRNCDDLWASGGGYAADINRDCKVDFKDLAILAQEWLRCYIPGDVSCEVTWP